MDKTTEKTYTLEEAAVRLGVSYPWLRTKMAEGVLRTEKVKPLKGRKRNIVREEELIRFEKALKEDIKNYAYKE